MGSKIKGGDGVRCLDRRPCFARYGLECIALTSGYKEGECPFHKECLYDVVVNKETVKKHKRNCEECSQNGVFCKNGKRPDL